MEEKLAELDGRVKEIAPKFYQHLEDMETERRKLEEKARQDQAEMQSLRSRDKTERPLKKGEFIAAADKRKQQGGRVFLGSLAVNIDIFFSLRLGDNQAIWPLRRMTMTGPLCGTNRRSPTSL